MSSKGGGATGHGIGVWPIAVMVVVTSFVSSAASGQDPVLLEAQPVRVVTTADGQTLQVDGDDFMVIGMNWGYIPIGENYNFVLWNQPDEVIEAALAREMPLLRNMGVNAIRQYVGIPPRWIEYIYRQWGIYTILNHTCGRYGFTLDGTWTPQVDYSDPRMREAIRQEVVRYVEAARGTPGLLMYLLGNENNYGLSWSSFEIEALPEGERQGARARHLYTMFEEITLAVKSADPELPVAMANGDVQYIDIIAEECKSLDVFGTNVYRGISVRDLYQVVNDKLGIPVMYTEFGADAWNAREMREDQVMQAKYLLGQWQEIYEQSAGKGRVGNAIGGAIFQWTDGWWKFGQESRLEIHDTNASWPNGGYVEDYVPGENNMNEEWWGICAKGRPDHRWLFEVYPRAAYYALRTAFKLDPYAVDVDIPAIQAHFRTIEPVAAELEARGDRAAMPGNSLDKVRVTNVRIKFETYNTGGDQISTPKESDAQTALPSFIGYDRMQSFFVDVEARPAENVVGTLSVNVLGRVAENPVDEIFYENRGRPQTIEIDGEPFVLNGIERVKVYQAGVSWDDRWFLLDAFFRTGHLHWGYEGDFFGLYRDAYYGANLDIYNGDAPVGIEITGKKALAGWSVAFGPQLWWGANPAVIFKYSRKLGPFQTTGIFHEDISQQSIVNSTIAIPQPQTRTATLAIASGRGPLGFELGGIWGGQPLEGREFQIVDENDDQRVLRDVVRTSDTFGGKVRLTYQKGRWNWYGQAAYMGLVAMAGPTPTITYTGWRLKDSGLGNQTNVITGLAVTVGKFQLSPNFLYQKPLVGPIPGDLPSPARPRNIIDDPFAVRANRETRAAELLITFDPTPATWMWQWDNAVREDAGFASHLGVVYRDHPTTQDAAIGIQEDGITTFAFPGAPPPRSLWEVYLGIRSRRSANLRMALNAYVGTGEPNGDDARLIERFGIDGRIAYRATAFEGAAKFDDWGPFDYHRDSNLTFPVQLAGDLSYSLGAPRWFGVPQTKLGVRGTWRSLDQFSNRYCPGRDDLGECDPEIPGPKGREWEMRTYLHLSM